MHFSFFSLCSTQDVIAVNNYIDNYSLYEVVRYDETYFFRLWHYYQSTKVQPSTEIKLCFWFDYKLTKLYRKRASKPVSICNDSTRIFLNITKSRYTVIHVYGTERCHAILNFTCLIKFNYIHQLKEKIISNNRRYIM